MRYSPLNPPPELLAALDGVVAGITAVRAQMHALQAVEALLLQTADMLAQQLAAAGSDSIPTASALNMAYRTVQAEIGAAVHESDRTVAVKMGRATELVEKYPTVYKALARGEVSGAHANAIVDAGEVVEDEGARAVFEQAVLEFAQVEAVSRLRPVAKQLAEKCAGLEREERCERARALRRVFVVEREDGMADLTAYLPAPYAYGIKDRLDQMARLALEERRRAEKAGGAGAGAGGGVVANQLIDNRTADQLRADLLTDMLLTSDFDQLRTNGVPAKNVQARVQVIVPVRRIKQSGNGRAGVTTGPPEHNTAATWRNTPMPGQNPAVPGQQSVAPGQQPMSPEPGVDEFAQLFGDLLDGVQPTLEGFAHDGLAHDGLAHDGLAHDGFSRDETEAECGVSSSRDVATLEGYGPISDADAVEIAAQADCWECVTVDTETGNVLTVDTYRPSAAQRRYLGARDLHCRFPGCRASLAWCDIDHTLDAALGGPTSSDNLGYLCRRHHTLKHASPWTVTQDQAGVYTWVSPTGRTYVDRPESNVRFRAVSDAEGTALPGGASSSPSQF